MAVAAKKRKSSILSTSLRCLSFFKYPHKKSRTFVRGPRWPFYRFSSFNPLYHLNFSASLPHHYLYGDFLPRCLKFVPRLLQYAIRLGPPCLPRFGRKFSVSSPRWTIGVRAAEFSDANRKIFQCIPERHFALLCHKLKQCKTK